MPYLIMINDDQRRGLLAALEASPQLDGDGQPLEYWTAMLTELPKNEAESPGTIHGFCL